MRKFIACWLMVPVCGFAFCALFALAGCKSGAGRGAGTTDKAADESGRASASSSAASSSSSSKAGATLAEVNAFTAELMQKVDSASSPAAGIDEALRLLDARGGELHAKFAAMKQSEGFRQSKELQRQALESEVENVQQVSGLRTRYMEEVNNPAFRDKLDKLVNGYQELYKP